MTEYHSVKAFANGLQIEIQPGYRSIGIGQQRVLLHHRAVFDVVSDAELVVAGSFFSAELPGGEA